MAEKRPRAAKATKKVETAKKAETAKKSPATAKAAAKPKTVRARKPRAAAPAPVTLEQIAERAYYIWAGGGAGDANAHWLQAERELTAA